MSSSNKNWPSMFKSKPCTNNHQHYHHNIHTPSYIDHYTNCNISSSFSPDHLPDHKPRWNPKPEQIRILQSIFDSGIVNPRRDEIQRIRIRLQEFGQIGDSNVFYWFQNRKSRSKHKLRALQENPKLSNKDKIISPTNDDDPYFGLFKETGLFPTQNNELAITEQDGFLFPGQSNELAESGFGFSDFVVPVEFSNVNNGVNLEIDEIPEITFYGGDENGGGNSYSPISVTVPLTSSQTQEQDILFSGARDCISPVRMMVFINDMPYEVVAGLFNVREAFGNEAVLINSFGQPILTDQFGVTLQPLQYGAVYYLI